MSAADVFQIISPGSLNTPGPIKRAGRVKRIYQCRHCARTFKRSEHCARHERVHTQERPFACAYCDRRYARKDLVKRHERSLHAEAYRLAHPEEFGHGSASIHSSSPAQGEEWSYLQHFAGAPGHAFGVSHSPQASLRDRNDVETAMSIDLSMEQQLSGLIPNRNIRTASMSTNGHAAYLPEPLLEHPPSHTRSHDYSDAAAPRLDEPNGGTYLDMNNMAPEYIGPEMSNSVLNFANPEMGTGTVDVNIQVDPILLENDPNAIINAAVLGTSPLDPQLVHTQQAALAAPDVVAGTQSPGQPFSAVLSGISDPYDIGRDGAHDPLGGGNLGGSNEIHVHKHPAGDMPEFHFSALTHQVICDDARSRLPPGEVMEALFPTVNDLTRFFSGYVQCFHRHFPIIHLPSLEVRETPSPLIFAICSIGAQYRLERQKAKHLFALAGTMSASALHAGLPISTGAPRAAPLWIMQTRVLLSLAGIFSEKASVVMRTIENLGLFAIEYRIRKTQLKEHLATEQGWEDWIGRESSKRLLYGMFIVSNLISVTYNLKPGFSTTEDLDIEALEDERLWNARDRHEWTELQRSTSKCRPQTVRAIMAHSIYGHEGFEGANVQHSTGFTLVLMLHAVNTHIWNLLPTLDCVRHDEPSLHDALTNNMLNILWRCETLVGNEANGISGRISYPQNDLMTNCEALLQLAYTRLSTDLGSFDRLVLLSTNTESITAAVINSVSLIQPRNPNVMKSVLKAYNGLEQSIKTGQLLLRKTAALTWSLESAIAAWDATLLLTRWIYACETANPLTPLSTSECDILTGLKALLAETESDFDGTGSLAAAVALLSSTFFNDLWVWGVTPKMGNTLQQLGFAFAEAYQRYGLSASLGDDALVTALM